MIRKAMYLSKHTIVLVVLCLALTVWVSASSAALAQTGQKEEWPKSFLIDGMSVGTSAYMVAASVANLMKTQLGIHTQVTAGVPLPVETNNVATGATQMGYTIANLPYDAFHGLYRWKGKQVKDMRILTNVVFVPYQMVTWPGTGIESVADLKGKTIMGDQAGVRCTAEVTRAFLAADGIKPKDVNIKAWREWSEQLSFIRMKLGDAINLEAGVGTAPVAELDRTMKLIFFPLKKKELDFALKKTPYIIPYTIPAGSYRATPNDYHTAAYSVCFAVSSKLPDSLVYEIAKLIYDKPGRFSSVSTQWGRFDPKDAVVARTAPYHAGAVKYYKEKGMWNANVDKWQKETLREAGLEK